ncbi:hypothetical protein H310_00259 [Aphanomyces invadans]|uniref:Hexose transporter 1 n=1 Tax=Aphanomyces invadans TaxID=157072 RepID=A0A024UVU7_9STRA|nr:hypothetical protein H310_00259 [Aphanomyces invadans]ETW09778.1 hypothetical protein H310_00259 [Aphanomyces invadans]|eukprot:XP_008861189.1 hypothetical protein H310_00259 [Aphanomyces invadans]
MASRELCQQDTAIASPSTGEGYVYLHDEARTHSLQQHRRLTSSQSMSQLDSMLVEEQVKSLKPSRAFDITVAIALLGAIQFGWLMSELNYKQYHIKQVCQLPVPVIDKKFPDYCVLFRGHSHHEWVMTTTAWVVGGGIGALGSGLPADVMGRKKGLALNAFLMIAGAIVQAASGTIYVLALGRFVSGIASGGTINISNVLISEITPLNMRGFFLTGLQVGISFGVLLVTTVHYGMTSEAFTWRILVGAPLLIGVLQLVLLPWMEESPVWLVAKNKLTLAHTALVKLYLPHDSDVILAAMVAAHTDEASEFSASRRRWTVLFTNKYRKQLGIACVLCAMQQLCGINAIMYYSASIFNSIGIHDPRYANTIVAVARMHDIVFAAKVLDRFNRRTLLLYGMFIMALCGGSLVLCLCHGNDTLAQYGAVGVLVVFVSAYCLSIGPMSWMVANELFPDYLNARAGAFGTFFTWASNFFVSVYFPQMADPGHLGNYAFLVFSGFLVAAVVFTYVFVPETNRKTYNEIQQALGIDVPSPTDEHGAATLDDVYDKHHPVTVIP